MVGGETVRWFDVTHAPRVTRTRSTSTTSPGLASRWRPRFRTWRQHRNIERRRDVWKRERQNSINAQLRELWSEIERLKGIQRNYRYRAAEARAKAARSTRRRDDRIYWLSVADGADRDAERVKLYIRGYALEARRLERARDI